MNILLISDTHLISERSVFDENIEVISSEAARIAPDMIVHLGDITADGASDATHMGYAFQRLKSLGRPIRYIPGNHDIGDNPAAPGQDGYESFKVDSLAQYRRVFGPDYWSFDAEGWQIIGLNAQLFGTGIDAEAEQFEWLETVLASRDTSLGLFLHKPLFRNGHDDDEVHIRYVPVEQRRRLFAMLEGRALKFVASGHVHQKRSIVVDGVEHFWVPSTSFCMPDAMQDRVGEKQVGVSLLQIEPDGTHRFHSPELPGLKRNNILHHPEIYPTIAAMRERLGEAAEL